MTSLTPHQGKALDYKKHISLTANAGSGKTFVLSKRYLEIALNENLSLRNIAAITFTDKAAGELYQKIAKEIDSRIKEAENKSLVEKLELIRRQLVSANISTIHSFCVDILRENPVEAGIDANFTPIDEIFSDELIELSVEEIIKKSLEDINAKDELKYLIRLFSSKYIFSRELTSSIKHRRNLLNLASKLYNKSCEEIAKIFYDTFLSFSEKILTKDLEKIIEVVRKINFVVLNSSPQNAAALEIKSILGKLEKKSKIENVIELLGDLKDNILTRSGGTVAIKGYLNREDSINLQGEIRLVEDFLGKLGYFHIPPNHAEIEIELAKFGKTFIHFFNKSLELYNEKKKEGGYLDYEDILLFAQEILQNEDVRKSLSEKFKYIMIDEYQDTNELQYNIFLPILDNLRKGNLFIVGDEKQSIYMFRDAELEIFNRTKNDITEKDGKDSLLSLPDSFRMAPNLCLFINTLFKNLFNNPNQLFNEVEHTDVVCARDDDMPGKVEILLAETTDEEDEEIAEAHLLSERILKLIHDNTSKEKIQWGDIAILCRKRKAFLELEKSFIRKNIPYSIIGGKGFYQRQSIYDIYNYFSFLLDQNDDTALIGILRSPFFSISDSEIFEISLQPKSNFWQKLKSYVSENRNYVKLVNLIQENISLVSKVEISFLLRKIITETGYLSVLSHKANSVQEQANVSKLINLTINFFTEGLRTLYDYVNYLKDAIGEVEDESQAVISDELNCVKVMTIHQAKGLEFPTVFLYRCGESTRKNSVKSKSVLINKTFGLLTKVPLDENYFSDPHSAPIIRLSDYVSEKKNIAEIKRLFYVGITRAKNNLFISASSKASGSLKSDSFLKLLQEGLDIDFESEEFHLNGKLQFLTKQAEKFICSEKELQVDIPIITKLETKPVSAKEPEDLFNPKLIILSKITNSPHGEMISATKLSLYNQCPLKYRLIYDYGFSNLMNQNREWIKNRNKQENIGGFDFNPIEDQQLTVNNDEETTKSRINFSQIKGTVIHKLLSDETSSDNLEDKTVNIIEQMVDKKEWDSNQIKDLKNEIIRDVKNYYNSKNYGLIKGFPNYKNEYEIYHQHDDYFLYGIIDKLIIDKSKIIIADYKTDSILVDEVKERAKHYFTQLKFYSYIASKLFTTIASFQLRIIFIKHPDEFFTLDIKTNDLLQIQNDIQQMVKNVRKQTTEKKMDHCKFCIFATNNTCIVT